MKALRLFLAVIMVFAISCSLLACGQKVNLETEADAIKYLEDYIEKNDKWSVIANKLGLYYSIVGSSKFNSTSYAKLQNGAWLVVIHGAIAGYTDYNKTQKGNFAFSYVAEVSTDGTVKEMFIQAGTVTSIN